MGIFAGIDNYENRATEQEIRPNADLLVDYIVKGIEITQA